LAEKRVSCFFCSGTGKRYADAAGNCSQCDGTGRVVMDFHSRSEETACESCNGTGKLEAPVTCNACKGTGRA